MTVMTDGMTWLAGASVLELMDDTFGDSLDGIGLRLGRAGDWTYAVAYGGWPGEFGPPAPVSQGGVHVCLLEYEEENGKPVPPHFEYFHDGRLLSAFNLHLDHSWGYDGVDGDPATATFGVARPGEEPTAMGADRWAQGIREPPGSRIPILAPKRLPERPSEPLRGPTR
jgi:hypothetical protein